MGTYQINKNDLKKFYNSKQQIEIERLNCVLTSPNQVIVNIMIVENMLHQINE